MLKVPVVNLRGANGSGKSFLAKQWKGRIGAEPYPRRANLFGSSTVVNVAEYYELNDGGRLIGNYSRDCGGADKIRSQDEVAERVRAGIVSRAKYVLFEGVIVSTVYEYWHNFSQSIGGMLWVYLDTPLEVCLKRVSERNKNKKFDESLVRAKIRQVASTRRRAEEVGERTFLLHWENAEQEFEKFMKENVL